MADAPTPELLAQTPPERNVVSFSVGVDNRGRAVVFKFLLRNKTTKTIIAGPRTAFHVRDTIRSSIAIHNYQDVLNPPAGAPLQRNKIDKFARMRPMIEDQDWDGMAGGQSHVSVGCDVSSFSNALFLSFLMLTNVWEIFRLNLKFVGHLAGVIDTIERDGKLVNLASVSTLSPDKH